MRKRAFTLACLTALCLGFTVKGAMAGQGTLPALPFEKYFQQKTGFKDTLRFHDFSGKIKPERIKKLLRSGAILGDRVLLQNNTSVYFPEGYIVSTNARFDSLRLKSGVETASLNTPHASMLEPNPDYQIVSSVEKFLGKTCAEATIGDTKYPTRIRKREDGMISVVKRVKARFSDVVDIQEPSVVITSAMDPKYLSEDGQIRALASSCSL